MSYQATVIPIMIASPGDVLEESNVARDVIHEWNYVNSSSTMTVFMPVRWETHSSPELGRRPQELINERVLKHCDLLVGIFWTRLGTPTGQSASGTVEEIERHVTAKKPAMVYFSTRPVAPQSIDQAQFNALSEFRAWCQKGGLVQTSENIVDFREKFGRQLQITFNSNSYIANARGNLNPAASSSMPVGVGVVGTPAINLSEEAYELIREASLDKNGAILKVRTVSGLIIQANGRAFGDSGDRRSMARWEYALEQLLGANLIVARGHKGEFFEVTEKGYRFAEALA